MLINTIEEEEYLTLVITQEQVMIEEIAQISAEELQAAELEEEERYLIEDYYANLFY